MNTKVLWAHKGVKWVSLGWLGFISENLILSHNRDFLIEKFDEESYHLAYNGLSTIACMSIAFGFIKYGKTGTAFHSRGSFVRQFLGFSLQALGLAGLSQLAPKIQLPVAITRTKDSNLENDNIVKDIKSPSSYIQVRCPIDFKAKGSPDGIYGMDRVSRHSTLWFLGFTCLGSAITSLYPTHLVMFTFPIVFAYIGGEHQDYRYRKGSGGYLPKHIDEETSNVPFAAIVTGKQDYKKVIEEIKGTNAGLGLLCALSLALRRVK